MKTMMLPIEMIAWSSTGGSLTPLKFMLSRDGKPPAPVRVENVFERREDKHAGNRMLAYRCDGEISGELRMFELKYEIGTCRWYLFKI